MFEHLDSLASVGYYISPPGGAPMPCRIPEHAELVELLTGGSICFEQDGVRRIFSRGTIFWHLEGEETISRSGSPLEAYRCATFRFSVKERRRLVPRVSCWRDSAEAARFAIESLKLFHDDATNRNFLGAYIYGTLIRHAGIAIASGGPGEEELPEAIRTAVELLEKDPGIRISVEQLARKCSVSAPHLHKLFREHLKTSPHQYQLNRRLVKAKTMLASGSEIKETAQVCGFDSLEVFYRSFRSATGLTPGDYRRQYSAYRVGE